MDELFAFVLKSDPFMTGPGLHHNAERL
jgi:hypothetical protein